MATNPVKSEFTGASVTEGGFRTALNNLIDWVLENKLTKATQADAEAGTDNALYMTPLNTWQAIAKYLLNVTTQPANDNSKKVANTEYVDRAVNGGAALGSKIQPVSAGIASNALTITLSPTVLDFRSQTLNDGLVTTIKSATNQSINLPTGASLGFTSGISGRMAVLAFNNGGSILLGVANVLGQSIDESDLKTTTVISGSSTAINAVYTNAGSLGANAYRVVGYVDATWVSGTGWTAVQKTQGAGGLFRFETLTDGATVTAAGTAIDVTPIPSWVKKLTIKFHEVSTNGTANYQIQLGSASVQINGYTSALSRTGSNAVATGNVFTGFGINSVNASNLLSGVIQITRSPNNIYECFGMLSDNSGGAYFVSGGVTLSGLLDRIRITTTASDSFDNGSFDFFYE